MSDAFTPLTSLTTLTGAHRYDEIYRQCDVFDIKYKTMVENIAQYLNGITAFTGRVIFVSTPTGIKSCESVNGPNEQPSDAARRTEKPEKRSFWYHSNPQGGYLHPDSTGAFHHFGKLRQAEHVWLNAFQKHAPRLKLAVLNITSMSDGRADHRSPGSDCQSFCWPGLPHLWAEMMFRMLEQSIHGATDGLY